jgi:TctA family transporter
MQKRDYGDIIGGVALIVGGTAFAIIGADYNIGTLRRMGPGYFPLSIGIILIAFGFLVALPALIRAGVTPKPEWRPLVNLFYCFIGVLLGTFIGVLPGHRRDAGHISLLLPVTYYLQPEAAIIMLAGIYYGANTAARRPRSCSTCRARRQARSPASTATRWPRQGRAAWRCSSTTVASFVGAPSASRS